VRLQGDPENSIRTNTVIFIGKVVPSLSDMAKSKLILPSFVRGMRDGFAPCRLASLKAVVACREHFEERALALEVLPVVVPGLVDEVAEVREEATRVVEEFIGVLREVGERMAQDERRKCLIDQGEAVGGGDTGVTAGGWMGIGGSGKGGNSSTISLSTPTPASEPTSGKSSYLSGLGSWATSKISSSATTETASAPSSANRNCAEITITKPSSTASQQQKQTLEKKKELPAFSSLGLSDANIGGNSGGWSDDEDEFNNFGGAQHQDNNLQQQSNDLLPSWTSSSTNGNDDNFMATFNEKPAIRPRGALGRPVVGGGGKLNTLASGTTGTSSTAARRRAEMALRKKEKAKEKASVMKLTAPSKVSDGLDDGWDDF